VDQKRLVPSAATVAGLPVFVEVDNLEAVTIGDNSGIHPVSAWRLHRG